MTANAIAPNSHEYIGRAAAAEKARRAADAASARADRQKRHAADIAERRDDHSHKKEIAALRKNMYSLPCHRDIRDAWASDSDINRHRTYRKREAKKLIGNIKAVGVAGALEALVVTHQYQGPGKLEATVLLGLFIAGAAAFGLYNANSVEIYNRAIRESMVTRMRQVIQRQRRRP